MAPHFFGPFMVPRIEKIGGDLVRREVPVPPLLGDGLILDQKMMMALLEGGKGGGSHVVN